MIASSENDDSKFQIIFNNVYLRLIILNNLRGINDLFRLMMTSKHNKDLIDHSRKSMKIIVNSYWINDRALKYLSGTFKLEFKKIGRLSSTGFQQLCNISKIKLNKKNGDLINKMTRNNNIKKEIKIKRINNKPPDELINLYSTIAITSDLIPYLENTNNFKATNIKTIIFDEHPFSDIPRVLNILSSQEFSRLKQIKFRRNSLINNEFLKIFSKSKTLVKLHIWGCEGITSEGIKYLTQIENLKLNSMKNIKDEVFQSLQNLVKLTLIDCSLGGNGFKYLNKSKLKYVNLELLRYPGSEFSSNYLDLEGIEYVSLFEPRVITVNQRFFTHIDIFGEALYIQSPEDFKHLKSLKSISIYGFKDITDNYIKNLMESVNVAKFQSFEIFGGVCITDESLKYLKGVKKVSLLGCIKITDKGLSYLDGVEKLNISDCKLITDLSMKYLWNCKKANVSKLPLLTDIGYSQLSHVKKIEIGCKEFPLDSLKHFSKSDKVKLLELVIPDHKLHYLKSVKIVRYKPPTLSISGVYYLILNGVLCGKD